MNMIPHFKKFSRSLNDTYGLTSSPTIALAISGGGLRSMLVGAGVLSAYDEETPGAESQMGGVLQCTSYIAGISGGLWIVMNNLLNDGQLMSHAMDELFMDLQSPILEGIPNMELNGLRHGLDNEPAETISAETNKVGLLGSMVEMMLPNFVKSMFSVGDGGNAFNVKSVLNFYKDISLEAHSKKESGYRISLIDYWARTLARRVIPKRFRSPGFTISSAAKLLSFQNYSQPFPIITSVELVPGCLKNSIDSHIIEMTPFEFGSWDSFLNAFMNVKYLGTKLLNGVPMEQDKTIGNMSVCTSGYDTLAFLTATSSGLFNTMFRYVYKLLPQLTDELVPYLQQVLEIFGFSKKPDLNQNAFSEYAIYSPNPFLGYHNKELFGRSVENTTSLLLADGGEDGQNIPFSPFLVPGRQVDAILAFDMGSEVYNRPNGSSLRASANRYHANESQLRIPLFQDPDGVIRKVFPEIPKNVESYFSSSSHERPVFFGCEMEDFPKHLGDVLQGFKLHSGFIPPLIVYQANHDISFPSNTSTFRTTYSPEEAQGLFSNGYDLAVNAEDSQYRSCLYCAFMKRKRKHLPDYCQDCFEKYCYKAESSTH